jgi:hypothetical protein
MVDRFIMIRLSSYLTSAKQTLHNNINKHSGKNFIVYVIDTIEIMQGTSNILYNLQY